MRVRRHDDCGGFPARIQGRSLQVALNLIKPNHSFSKFHPSNWVTVCPQCDAYALGAEFEKQWPFLCFDGAWRVVRDFDGTEQQTSDAKILTFCTLKFSAQALDDAIHRVLVEDEVTQALEGMGAQLDGRSDFLAFCQSVCAWGGGQRVYANLIRRNGETELRRCLQDWLLDAKNNDNIEEIIAHGVRIHGLGVSFASKHLRMLNPQKYAVLDSVLSEGLGFALNPKGYSLFMTMLLEFKARHQLSESLSRLEAGIFYLVRQQVRAAVGEGRRAYEPTSFVDVSEKISPCA